jgi:hypothetical protein
MSKERTLEAIAQAVRVLRDEESSLTEEISALQNRLTNVRSAVASMRNLLEPDLDKGLNAPQVSLALDDTGKSSYDGLPFAKALFKFMSTVSQAMTVREITDGLKAAGYKFNSANETTQVYIGLKRSNGSHYALVEGKKWISASLFANPSSSQVTQNV